METLTKTVTTTSMLDIQSNDRFNGFRDWVYELLPQSSTFVAVEFDVNLIKLIVLDGRGKKEHVHFLKVKYVSSEQDEEIGKVLFEILQELRLRPGTKAAISIPRQNVHVKMLRLPGHDKDELRKMVGFQLQKNIPISPAEIVYDFRVVAKEEDGYTQVLAVIARKAEIDRYSNICRKVGLTIDAIRLNVEAIYHSFVISSKAFPEHEDKCLALVDIDFSTVNVIIIDQGQFQYCRSFGKGVAGLMKSLEGMHHTIIYETWINELTVGLQRTLSMFESNSSHGCVEHVVLTGWLPRINALVEKLTDNLNKPVSWFDLMIPCGASNNSDNIASMRHWFSISTLFGMAKARHNHLMDLRSEEQQQSQRWRHFIRQTCYSVLLIFYLAILTVIAVNIELNNRHSEIQQMQESISALNPEVNLIKKWQIIQQELQQQLGPSTLTAAQIAQVLAKLPASVELSSLTFMRGEKILLRATANALKEVFEIPQSLSQQPTIKQVTITTANRRKMQNQRVAIEFEMEITLK